MATFGPNPALNTFNFSGLNTDNEIFTTAVSVPENARCQSITINMGRHTAGNVNTQFCIWDASTGALIVASAVTAVGARADQTIAIADTVLKAGRSVWIGFWRDPSLDAEWGGQHAVGSFNFAPASGGAGSPQNPISATACAPAFDCGQLRAFVTYIPILTWVGRAGAWQRDLVVVGRAGAWSSQAVPVKVGRAGAWTQIG